MFGGSFRQRMKTLCEGFIASSDYKEIYDTVSAVEGLEARLGKIKAAAAAITRQQEPLITDCERLQKTIHTITRSLEDLLMSAMEGLDVSQLARRELLLYQNAPDINL